MNKKIGIIIGVVVAVVAVICGGVFLGSDKELNTENLSENISQNVVVNEEETETTDTTKEETTEEKDDLEEQKNELAEDVSKTEKETAKHEKETEKTDENKKEQQTESVDNPAETNTEPQKSIYDIVLEKEKASSGKVIGYAICDVNKDGIDEMYVNVITYGDLMYCRAYTFKNNEIYDMQEFANQVVSLLVKDKNLVVLEVSCIDSWYYTYEIQDNKFVKVKEQRQVNGFAKDKGIVYDEEIAFVDCQ